MALSNRSTRGRSRDPRASRASADAAEAGVDALAQPDIAELPATRLYLADTFPRFLEVLRTTPVLPSLEEAREAEERVVRAGEAMVLEIWRRLGLSVVEHEGRQWELRVTEPVR